MLTINKFAVSLSAGNVQNNQKSDMPKLKTLTQDTVSFKGIETEYLLKIAKGELDSHISGVLLEQPLRENEKLSELQTAFNTAYRTGKARKILNAYLERRPELKKPE